MQNAAAMPTTRTPRRRVLQGARLLLEDHSTYDCVVRDMSETGIRVRLSSPTPLPQALRVFILSRGLIYPVRLCWNRMGEAGFEIAGQAEICTPTQAQFPGSGLAGKSPASGL